MPTMNHRIKRIVAEIQSATSTHTPRGSAGDVNLVVVRNDQELAAAKQQAMNDHPQAVLLALLDFAAEA